MSDVILESTITCPECGHDAIEVMPTDACQWFYECQSCQVLLKPLQGHCCVFCSYGTIKCPPIQKGDGYSLSKSFNNVDSRLLLLSSSNLRCWSTRL